MLQTINGIDVVLLLLVGVFAFLYVQEKAWTRDLETIIEDDDDGEVLEYAEQSVRIVCGSSSHWEQVQAFRGNGKPGDVETIPRVNPPEVEQICLLVHQHAGPHMGSTAIWE